MKHPLAWDGWDALIQEYAAQYVPWDWRQIKAQLYQESAFDNQAESSAGAQGPAQAMPATWQEWSSRLKFPENASVFEPRYAIEFCCAYMRSRRAFWYVERPEEDRWKLALASYNCGPGYLIEAQKIAHGASRYDDIIACLGYVRRVDHVQVETYVRSIVHHYEKLKGAP